jgi:hypothetical protein
MAVKDISQVFLLVGKDSRAQEIRRASMKGGGKE